MIPAAAPVLTAAVSRLTHGNGVTFDVQLPLSGASGIESHDDRVLRRRIGRREMLPLPVFVPPPRFLDVIAHGGSMQREQEILVVASRCAQCVAAKSFRTGQRRRQRLNPPCHVRKPRALAHVWVCRRGGRGRREG